MRLAIGAIFLSAQLFSIAYHQFVPTRYFCWAPNDYAVSYSIQVKINGRTLSPEEIKLRYRLAASGVYENVVVHLIDIWRQYETTYGRNDHAQIVLIYSTNGAPQKEWTWPET
jgi:hypothetical protein